MPDDVLMDRLRAADPLEGELAATPSLDALGLTAGALGEQAPKLRRTRRRWGTTALSVVLGLLVGTATAAASLTALTGDPLGRTPQVDIEPTASTVRIAEARSPDPDGGPEWGVRLGRAGGGLLCIAVGQVQDGRLGLVGLDGIFRADRPRGADDCAVASLPTSVMVQGRTFVGRDRGASVSVIYGAAGRDIDRVFVSYPDVPAANGPTPIRIAADRTFVLAQRGSLTERSPHFSAIHKQRPGATYGSMTSVDFGRPWTQQQIWSRQRAGRTDRSGGRP